MDRESTIVNGGSMVRVTRSGIVMIVRVRVHREGEKVRVIH
jgi:hypothetical protein